MQNSDLHPVRTTRGSLLGIASVAMIALATGASAQTSGTASEAGTDTGGAIGDIVVTAQRRSERLQDVPISISALTASDLQASGMRSTESISQTVPGVVITRTQALPIIFIRGVGTQNSSPGEEGSNSVYIDGVLISSLPASVLGLANIERVEVLKGPQGTCSAVTPQAALSTSSRGPPASIRSSKAHSAMAITTPSTPMPMRRRA